MSDGIEDEKKNMTWPTPLNDNRSGGGRVEKRYGKESRELDKNWLEIPNGRSAWRNFLTIAAFYMGFGVRAKMAVHGGPNGWGYRWGGSALGQVW